MNLPTNDDCAFGNTMSTWLAIVGCDFLVSYSSCYPVQKQFGLQFDNLMLFLCKQCR